MEEDFGKECEGEERVVSDTRNFLVFFGQLVGSWSTFHFLLFTHTSSLSEESVWGFLCPCTWGLLSYLRQGTFRRPPPPSPPRLALRQHCCTFMLGASSPDNNLEQVRCVKWAGNHSVCISVEKQDTSARDSKTSVSVF